MALGGVDIGTSGCKCTIMTEKGETLATCYQEYTASRTAGAHEIDVLAIWQAVQHVIKTAVADSGQPVEAICVTSFGETCVMLDKQGQVAFPTMLYTDPRGEEQCRELIETVGEQEIYHISGHQPHPIYFLPKLMWVRDNAPDLFSHINVILPINSCIIYWLTGVAVSDESLASRTMLLDIHTRDWSERLLEAAKIERTLLPKVVSAGTIAGTILPEVAHLLGVQPSMKIVVGPQDQIAAVIGAGALHEGSAVNGTGTVECFTPVFREIPTHPILYDGGYAIVPAPNGLYVTYSFIYTGGVLLQWYRDHFAGLEHAASKAAGKNVYALLDEGVRPEPTGLLTLPHFAGAATPYMSPTALGAIIGLSLANTSADVYQSLMEGVCYETRMSLDLLAQAGICFDHVRSTGGGSHSKIWMQMKSTILNKKMETLDLDEAGAAGSVMLAGCAVGVYDSLEQAAAWVHVKHVFTPGENRELYEPIFKRYKKVYDAVHWIYE